jgi:hypothetical protein
MSPPQFHNEQSTQQFNYGGQGLPLQDTRGQLHAQSTQSRSVSVHQGFGGETHAGSLTDRAAREESVGRTVCSAFAFKLLCVRANIRYSHPMLENRAAGIVRGLPL